MFLILSFFCVYLSARAETVEQLVAAGRLKEALPVLERAKAAADAAGRHDLEVARLLNNLGAVYQELGRPADAKRQLEGALLIRAQLHTQNSEEQVTTLLNLGTVYRSLGLLRRSETAIRQAERNEEEGSRRDAEIAKIQVSLAQTFQAEGRWRESEALLRKALEIQDQPCAGDANLGRTLNELAAALMHDHNFADSEAALNRSLAILRTQLGPTHPQVATVLHNLGALYIQMGRTEEAESDFEAAIGIALRALPADHPDLASYRMSYALLLRKLHRKREAAKMEALAKEAHQEYARENLLYTVDARR